MGITTIKPTRTPPDTLQESTFSPTFFNDHFTLLIAQTPDEQYRAFALRHAVFIEELNYAIGNENTLNIECDAHDQHSLLCLLHHNATGIDVGCVRVVLIEPVRGRPLCSLPLEAYYPAPLFMPDTHPHAFSSDKTCEVSRLAVHPTVRKKPLSRPELASQDFPSTSPTAQTPYESIKESPALLSLSLFLAATAMVGLSGRHHVFAMLEPRFSRLLKASGLHFQQVGGVINYCGSRAPYYIDQRVAEAHLPKRIVPLYHTIKTQLAVQLLASLCPACR
ncbi:PEP-CTERM/exosortase system-associated acyltransferase [Vreelandella aquamarina]|jgi:N-acyl amino acid synthase of PEP-CTERM/exosortase system|uniref:PEP-CTERM/exosortase system-associated acyltransferase n=1 Tax=Vreelandella aquamarina TaxID=77097 RepID=UPI00155256DE|nr:PEP-CTERM/exosortase system-associated acyltransferase [Halomonas meridiana]|tara:strand:+ start:1491 stop:2324 length:834 start_codon:yes stop_codon:yes gene_type:complete